MIAVTRICESCGRSFKQAWLVDTPLKSICPKCENGSHAH